MKEHICQSFFVRSNDLRRALRITGRQPGRLQRGATPPERRDFPAHRELRPDQCQQRRDPWHQRGHIQCWHRHYAHRDQSGDWAGQPHQEWFGHGHFERFKQLHQWDRLERRHYQRAKQFWPGNERFGESGFRRAQLDPPVARRHHHSCRR